MLEDTTRLTIFRTALTARRFEARITTLARAGELPATLHAGAGQEVCQVAALAALRPDDPMLYGHRGTAYWLARGVPMEQILCDIAYRDGGTNKGRGGVMHVVDTARGVLGESGTLGGNFVIGTGVAYADRHAGREAVTMVFFGDGAANRGQFHEALNFAAVRRLPLILFCENNGWGLSVPATESTAVADIADRAAGYGIPGVVVDGRDPEPVFEAVSEAAARARAGEGPSLVEAKVDRLLPHFLGDRENYRRASERTTAEARDPLTTLTADVSSRGLIDEDGLAAMEAEIEAEIDRAVARFRTFGPVDVRHATEGLFADG